MTQQIRLLSALGLFHTGVVERTTSGEIRERSASELLHYRKEVTEPCHLCNQEGSFVWIDRLDRWRNHPQRCNAVAFICRVKD